MNSKAVGNVAEAKVLAAFVEQGWAVLTPFGDNERYDLVIDRGRGFERIQVKAGRLRGGVVQFNCYSTVGRINAKAPGRGYQGEADAFAVYCRESGNVYLIPVDEAGHTTCHLRVDVTLNGQAKNVRWARDYLVS